MIIHFNKYKKFIVLFWLSLLSSFAVPAAFDDFFSAAQRDDESAIVALALRGFDLNTRDASGNHALLLAVREGSLKVANFLIDQPSVQVEARNVQGESPLMMAALKGHLALAKRLIERKAEVNKPGWAPLHYAATNAEPGSTDMVRLLLEHHAYIDAESPNRTTPLMMAAQYGLPAVVKLLLEEGATVLRQAGPDRDRLCANQPQGRRRSLPPLRADSPGTW
jgi:ankyrin repeat protein